MKQIAFKLLKSLLLVPCLLYAIFYYFKGDFVQSDKALDWLESLGE